MSRALVTINHDYDRVRAAALLGRVPYGTRVEFKGSQRSIKQNDVMWGMLTDIASQKLHNGRRYTADQWKVIFLHALGREVQFIPSLDGSTFIPWGQSSSDLSKQEMMDLIELLLSWGAQNAVVFSKPPRGCEIPQEDAA